MLHLLRTHCFRLVAVGTVLCEYIPLLRFFIHYFSMVATAVVAGTEVMVVMEALVDTEAMGSSTVLATELAHSVVLVRCISFIALD